MVPLRAPAARPLACFALALALLSSPACRRLTAPRDLDRSVEVDDRVSAGLRALRLAPAPAGALEPVRPTTRVVLTRQRLSVDDAAVLRSWPHEVRVRAVLSVDAGLPEAWPLDRPSLLTLRDGAFPEEQTRARRNSLLLPELQGALLLTSAVERAQEPAAARVLTVYAEADVPPSALTRVLYTALQSGYSAADLALREGTRLVALRFDPPRSGEQATRTVDRGQRRALAAASEALRLLGQSGLAEAGAGESAADAALPSSPFEALAAAAQPSGPLALSVEVRAEGYAVNLDGVWLRPGCATVGASGVIAPLGDTAALSRCLATARAQPDWRASLAATDHVLLSAVGPERTVGELLAAALATRETSPGARDLFPRTLLGARLP